MIMFKNSIFIFLFALTMLGCKKDLSQLETNWTYQLSKVKHAYIATSKELWTKNKNTAGNMIMRLQEFRATPTFQRFSFAKNAWTESYKWFNIAKPLILSTNADPIVNEFQIDLNRIHLNQIDPSYIDYTQAAPNDGIIVNTAAYPTLDFQSVADWHLHGTPGNENKITLGYHVLEFLLWGENGMRTNDEFEVTTTEGERRNFFFSFVASHLSNDFNQINWPSSMENKVLAMTNQEFVSFIFTGMIDFIDNDFLNTTILVPYESQNVADELSRFSKNTMADIENKLDAITYFIDGRELLLESSDYFLGDLFEEIDSEKFAVLEQKLESCYTLVESISGTFNTAVLSATERPKLLQLHTELTEISGILKEYREILSN